MLTKLSHQPSSCIQHLCTTMKKRGTKTATNSTSALEFRLPFAMMTALFSTSRAICWVANGLIAATLMRLIIIVLPKKFYINHQTLLLHPSSAGLGLHHAFPLPPPTGSAPPAQTHTYKSRRFQNPPLDQYKPFKVADVLVVILTADLDDLAQQLIPESKMMILVKLLSAPSNL